MQFTNSFLIQKQKGKRRGGRRYHFFFLYCYRDLGKLTIGLLAGLWSMKGSQRLEHDLNQTGLRPFIKFYQRAIHPVLARGVGGGGGKETNRIACEELGALWRLTATGWDTYSVQGTWKRMPCASPCQSDLTTGREGGPRVKNAIMHNVTDLRTGLQGPPRGDSGKSSSVGTQPPVFPLFLAHLLYPNTAQGLWWKLAKFFFKLVP